MPLNRVYLPDVLCEAVKKRLLSASELLQSGVRSKLRRRKLVAESVLYTADLEGRVGRPTARQQAQATALAQRIAARSRRS